MKLDIYNKEGKKLSTKLEVDATVFGIQPHEHSVYLAVKSEMASIRQGSHSSKTRSEVSGSGKKPWKQKGTGRARAGSLRNPARVHGGSAFGPKPRTYKIEVNRKVRRLARKSVLSEKNNSGELIIVNNFELETTKTKEFSKILSNLGLNGKKVTVLVNEETHNIYLSARNIRNLAIVSAISASTYDLIDCQVLLAEKAGIIALNQQLAN